MKRHAPATARNRVPILEVLRGVLPVGGLVVEVASGTGEHAAYFGEQLDLRWQPTDRDATALASIAAHTQSIPNVLEPLELDAASNEWPIAAADAVVCINMIHISPFEATEGLFRGAGELLEAGAPLVTYGPYTIDGKHTAESNLRFDASLRSRDARWGVRDIARLEQAARLHAVELEERIAMPANNFALVWRRR